MKFIELKQDLTPVHCGFLKGFSYEVINENENCYCIHNNSNGEEIWVKKSLASEINEWILEGKLKAKKEEYFEFAENFYSECLEISRKKNADYTGGNDDPFANFSSVEQYDISTEQGFIVRMNDKMKRISSFVKNGTLHVEDESVLDTLQDLANYACLMAGYINSKK